MCYGQRDISSCEVCVESGDRLTLVSVDLPRIVSNVHTRTSEWTCAYIYVYGYVYSTCVVQYMYIPSLDIGIVCESMSVCGHPLLYFYVRAYWHTHLYVVCTFKISLYVHVDIGLTLYMYTLLHCALH